MMDRLKALNELHTLKEQAKAKLKSRVVLAKIQEGTLLVLRLEVEDLRVWLRVVIDEDLMKISPHPK